MLHRSFLGVSSAVIGGTGFVFALKKAVDVAQEEQVVNKRLIAQLDALHISYKANAKLIEETLEKQSKLSAFYKGDLKGSFTTLVRVTKDVNEALKLNALAADVARGKNVDLQTATLIVTKAAIGQTGALKRMGIAIDPVKTAQNALTDSHKHYTTAVKEQAKALDLAATKHKAIAYLQQRFAGQARAYGNSSAGAMDKFRNSLRESEKTIGNALLPTLGRLARAGADWLDKSNKNGQLQREVNDAVKTGSDIVRGAVPIVKDLANASQAVAKALGGWKNASEIILSGVLASKILKLAGAFRTLAGAQGVGAATGAISGEGGLLAGLRTLAAIGTITIAVEILIHRKWIEDHLGNLIDKALGVKVEPGTSPGVNSGVVQQGIRDMARRGLTEKEIQKRLLSQYGIHATIAQIKAAERGDPTGDNAANRAALNNLRQAKGVTNIALAATRAPGSNASSFHLPGERAPYDCSAFTQAVFRQAHITIGSTTYTQFAGGRKVNRNDLQPGDLVFFNYPGERSPGHVGIYVGGGKMVHDHGASRGVSYQAVDWAHFVGARCYIKGHQHTGQSGGTNPSGDQTSIDTLLGQGTKGSKGGSSGLNKILPPRFQESIQKALGTAGKADDLKAYAAALAYLKNELAHTSNTAKRVAIEKEINKINRSVNAIKADELKAKLKKIHDAFTSTWGTLSEGALKAFDRATQRGLDEMRANLDAKLKAIAADLKGKLAAIDAFRSALTPAEQALKALQEQHDSQQMQQSITDAQTELQKALAGGDPEAIKQAQQALAELLYEQQVAALQRQADAERQARDADADAQAQAAQDDADAQSQAAQTQYDTDVAAYQDQRDLLRGHLEEMLKLWLKYYLARNELAGKAKEDLLAFIHANPGLGITDADIDAMLNVPGNPLTAPPGSGLPGSSTGGGTGGGGAGGAHPMAKGGIALRPTLALIGEAGPEAVVPLSKGGFGTPTININIGRNYGDAEQLAREVAPAIRREMLRLRKRNLDVGLS